MLLLATLLAAAATSAAPAHALLAELLKGHTAGPPRACVNANDLERPITVPGIGVVWEQSPRLRWLNRFRGGCSRLSRERIVVTRSTNGSLCSNDRVTLVAPPSLAPAGSCQLGPFEPYVRAISDNRNQARRTRF